MNMAPGKWCSNGCQRWRCVKWQEATAGLYASLYLDSFWCWALSIFMLWFLKISRWCGNMVGELWERKASRHGCLLSGSWHCLWAQAQWVRVPMLGCDKERLARCTWWETRRERHRAWRKEEEDKEKQKGEKWERNKCAIRDNVSWKDREGQD